MTDRIDYFVAQVDGDPERVTAATRLFVCVSRASVTSDGRVVGILDPSIRDEAQSYGVVDAAVRSLRGVTDVRKVCMGFSFGGSEHRALVEDVLDAVWRHEPKVPDDERELDGYVRESRLWAATARRLRKAVEGGPDEAM